MEIWGVLGVLVSYEVTIWIRLVVARVHIGLGGSRVFWGGLEGSRGCLLYSYKALFVLYGTRLCSKHHIIVQPANVYRIDITGPFLNL